MYVNVLLACIWPELGTGFSGAGVEGVTGASLALSARTEHGSSGIAASAPDSDLSCSFWKIIPCALSRTEMFAVLFSSVQSYLTGSETDRIFLL